MHVELGDTIIISLFINNNSFQNPIKQLYKYSFSFPRRITIFALLRTLKINDRVKWLQMRG